MKYPSFGILLALILLSSTMLVLGLYLLSNFDKLFRSFIRFEWLRKNMVVWMIAICFCLAIAPTNRSYYDAIENGAGWRRVFLVELLAFSVMVFIVFNITYMVSQIATVRALPFRKKMAVMLASIVTCTVLAGLPINYYANGGNFKNLYLTLLFNFYTGCMTGFVYVTMNAVNLERMQKMSEKELEVSRLQQLKAEAELAALHSKVNPHFLYNALNSISDLAILDGKRARQMTIALADLFRYSINYGQHNFATIDEELAMTDLYLQIEKIRFEDRLQYSLHVEGNLGQYLVPRFVLQPLAENAVKHGLKQTGMVTEIKLEVGSREKGLYIRLADNGPAFPDDLVPGYGVKSVFDKLDLLFPGQYEIYFHSAPQKEVLIYIHQLKKNEAGL